MTWLMRRALIAVLLYAAIGTVALAVGAHALGGLALTLSFIAWVLFPAMARDADRAARR